MNDTPADVLSPSARRRIGAGVVIALSGTLLGAGALLMAVFSVVAGDDRALWWMLTAILTPAWGCTIAWSRLMSVWAGASDKVRYFALKSSRPFAFVGTISSIWVLLSPIIALAALVWLVARLVDGAGGWLGVAIPVVIVSELFALGRAFTVAYDASDLGRSIPTFAFDTYIADLEIARELAKHPASGGSPDWNSFWLHRIAYVTEHPPVDRPAEDCVDHIVAARAAAGLPPLEGIESATAPRKAATSEHRSIAGGRFLVDGSDLGLAATSTATVQNGVLDADLTAAAVPARAETWALAPPRLYFHGLQVPNDRDGRIVIDEARLETCDIACYLDAHFDVFGILTIEATRLRFTGEIVIAADDRWPVEIDLAFEPGRHAS
jgi:hypothetical protein